MWNWLRSLLTGGRHKQPVLAAASRAEPIVQPLPAPIPVPVHDAEPSDDNGGNARFVSWLLDMPEPIDAPLSDAESDALAAIDVMLDPARPAAELLPRAPAVIPQLLSALRHSEPSLPALVERVSKDLQLVAEVMRMARSAYYRSQGEVDNLARAISTLGEIGLHSAIARVVLRPLFESGSGKLSARAAPRLWEHSEHKSRHCMQYAAAAGLDPFDGCLAGLMHNAGWTVTLRALDRCERLPQPWTAAFVRELTRRRDALFGKVVLGWQVSAGVTALAAEVATVDLENASSALAGPLLHSDREATRNVLQVAGIEFAEWVPAESLG